MTNPDNVRLSSKKEVDEFWEKHGIETCDINGTNYGGTIELVFCKIHRIDPKDPNNRYMAKGSYIFIDSEKNGLPNRQ